MKWGEEDIACLTRKQMNAKVTNGLSNYKLVKDSYISKTFDPFFQNTNTLFFPFTFYRDIGLCKTFLEKTVNRCQDHSCSK